MTIETVKVCFSNCHNTATHKRRSPSPKSGRGGGISMYIHDSLNFNSINIKKFKKHRSVNDLQASR